MGAPISENEHLVLVDGVLTFQSDKYPECPAGKVPLSVKDPTAQDLLWEYAKRRRSVDASFADAVEAALLNAGFDPSKLRWESIETSGEG